MDDHREISRFMALMKGAPESFALDSSLDDILQKLSPVGKGIKRSMSYFENIRQVQAVRESNPFRAMLVLARRADRILKARKQADIDSVAGSLEMLIGYYKSEQVEASVDEHVQRLYAVGGWELIYLPHYDDERPDEHDIRDLLDNWPADAPRIPDLLSINFIDDLEALQEAIGSGYVISGNSLPSFNEWEMYSVLALMKLDDAAWTLHSGEEDTPQKPLGFTDTKPAGDEILIRTANLLLEATEAVCYAEREFSNAQLREARDKQKGPTEERIAAAARGAVSKKALAVKNAPNTIAKKYIIDEWALHKNEYDLNKTAFCRTYVILLRNNFTNAKGEPFIISEKTMNEVWLSDSPVTRKRGPGC